MSVIEEALRRVQALPPQASQPPPRRSQDKESPAWRPSHLHWMVLGAVGVLVGGWGIWTLVVLLSPPPTVQQEVVSRPARPGNGDWRAGAQHVRPRSALNPGGALRPSLQLSGVVTGPGEPMAIINGHILKIGDRIEGATLLEVTDTSARLHWRDREFILRLAR